MSVYRNHSIEEEKKWRMFKSNSDVFALVAQCSFPEA